MIPNPYSPGSAPPTFLAGRSKELDNVRAMAAKVAIYGRAAGPLLAFYGPRGVGKTSLLRQAQAKDALAAGMLSVWVTGRKDHPLLPDLSRAIEHVLEVNKVLDQESRLRTLLRSAHVQVSGFGLTVGATGPGTSSSGTDATHTVETLLHATGRFVRDKDYGGLVVFIDEFQDLPLEDRTSLLIALQHFDGDPEYIPVAAVAAGLPSLPLAVTEAATFGERSTFVEIGDLSPLAVAEALLEPASYEHVSWTSEARPRHRRNSRVPAQGPAARGRSMGRTRPPRDRREPHHHRPPRSSRHTSRRLPNGHHVRHPTRQSHQGRAQVPSRHGARVSNQGTAVRNQIADELGVPPCGLSPSCLSALEQPFRSPLGPPTRQRLEPLQRGRRNALLRRYLRLRAGRLDGRRARPAPRRSPRARRTP